MRKELRDSHQLPLLPAPCWAEADVRQIHLPLQARPTGAQPSICLHHLWHGSVPCPYKIQPVWDFPGQDTYTHLQTPSQYSCEQGLATQSFPIGSRKFAHERSVTYEPPHPSCFQCAFREQRATYSFAIKTLEPSYPLCGCTVSCCNSNSEDRESF